MHHQPCVERRARQNYLAPVLAARVTASAHGYKASAKVRAEFCLIATVGSARFCDGRPMSAEGLPVGRDRRSRVLVRLRRALSSSTFPTLACLLSDEIERQGVGASRRSGVVEHSALRAFLIGRECGRRLDLVELDQFDSSSRGFASEAHLLVRMPIPNLRLRICPQVPSNGNSTEEGGRRSISKDHIRHGDTKDIDTRRARMVCARRAPREAEMRKP